MVIAGSLFIVGFFVASIVLLVKKKVTTGQFCAICAVAIIGGIITGNVDSIRSLVFSWGQGGSLSVELQQKVDLVEDTIKIADEGMRMRIGLRSGLDELLSIAETSPNEEMRLRAKNYFEKIASDYESFHQLEGG